MNLGDALRETLGQEADMQDPTRPDVGALIHGGRARRRRRTVARVGVVAAASVLLAGGVAFGVGQVGTDGRGGHSGIVDQPSESSDPSGSVTPQGLPSNPGKGDLQAGTYRVLVGTGPSGRVIQADLTFEGEGWKAGDFARVKADGAYGGFGVYRVYALADGSGCHEDVVDANAAQTAPGLAEALAQVPDSTVVEPATPTQLFGYDALHLQLRITSECPRDQYYRVAVTPRGNRGITYGPDQPPVTIDFWVLDYDGVPVVVDSWHQDGASADLVDRIDRARESITFDDDR